MRSGSYIIVYLVNPAEKYWGVLVDLTPIGVTLRAVNLSSFDDWMRSLAYGDDPPAVDLATVFFPLHRVERIFLDEQVGAVESMCQVFERRVGRTVAEVLGIGNSEAVTTN